MPSAQNPNNATPSLSSNISQKGNVYMINQPPINPLRRLNAKPSSIDNFNRAPHPPQHIETIRKKK